jgi:PAS domain S-box-containing protein
VPRLTCGTVVAASGLPGRIDVTSMAFSTKPPYPYTSRVFAALSVLALVVALAAWFGGTMPAATAAILLGGLLLAAAGKGFGQSRPHAELATTRGRRAARSGPGRRPGAGGGARHLPDEHLWGLIDSNAVPLVVTDGNRSCLEVNAAFLDLVGCPAGVTLALAAPGLLDHLLDQQAATEARTRGAALPYERTLVRPDGRRVAALVCAFAAAPGDATIGWLVIDLGARQRLVGARAHRPLLDVIFERAPVGLGVYDRDLRFLRLNHRLAEINGLPPEQQLGRRISDVLPGLPRQALEPFAHVFRTGEAVEGVEVRGRTPASPGERCWDVSYYPVTAGDGPLFGVAAVVHEVTDRRRAEAEREALLREAERARTEAESASRAKDEFLAVLSHELRAPLQGVLGWVSLLRDQRLDATQQLRALQAIERSTHLQTQLINDLLDVSRIIGGRLTVDSRPLDLAAAVREAIDHLRPSATAHGVTLDASVADCGVTLGDPDRLRQVLGNLLSNAIKFTPRGGTVSVRCERDGGDIVVAVEDTGEGIAPEFLPLVFERFRQADSSSSRRHGGLGLGLAIARRLVELHGGEIRAESDGVGRGARFTVRLAACDPLVVSAPSSAADDGALRGRRVLLVEDDADSREAISLALTLEGATVTAAGTADDALTRLGNAAPDAVVSDLSMPGTDGYALLAQLRARGVAAPAIAVSGLAAPEDRARALTAGFSAHVAKPVELDLLLRTLARLVEP